MRPYPQPSPTELINHLNQRDSLLRSVRSRAKADFLSGPDRVKVTVSVIAARPDHLRLSAENSFTGPLLTLATDGSSFQLLDVRQNRFLSGAVRPCNIARLIRVELTAREVVDILLGGAALLDRPSRTQVSWDGRDGGREVLTLADETGRTEVLRLSPGPAQHARSWDVREAELRDPSGRPVWRVSHSGFAALNLTTGTSTAEVRLPAETFMEDLRRKSDIRLRWKDRELNPALPDADFHLDPPPGVPAEVATCAG